MPLVVVTETWRAPRAAPEVMFSVAVIWVPLTTFTLLAVTPVPLIPTVAPARKFVPVRVTFVAVFRLALLGEIDVKAGAARLALTVKI